MKQGQTKHFFGREPMEGLLSAVTESIPDAVLSGEGRERIALLASRLPECGLESTFGFETRLDEQAPLCDFFLSIQANSDFSRYMIDRGSGLGVSASQQGLSRFLAEISDPMSELAKWFGSVILEYDLAARDAGQVRAAGVFIEPRSDLSESEDAVAMRGHTPLACGPDVVAASACLAVGRAEAAEETAILARAMAALPSGGELLHVGAMPGRGSRSLRLVFRMPSKKVAPFFEKLHWRGCLARLANLADFSRGLQSSDGIGVSCDILSGEVAPRVGFEVFLKEAWMNAGARQWAPLLSRLAQRGWCRPEKASALLSWPKTDTLLSDRGMLRLLTGVNHVKLVLEDEGVRSKAYLGAFLLPR